MSNIDSRGIQVDIIGERSDTRGVILIKLCLFYCILAILLAMYAKISNQDGLLYLCIGLEVLGVILLFISTRYNVEHAWVECKNQGKEKVNIEQIRKSFNTLQDHKATKDRKFKFNKHYFVSSSGYVDDAYHYAKSVGVSCYIVKNGNFVEADYWNI